MLFPSLLALGFGVAWFLSVQFFVVLCTYLAITTAYSFKLKRFALADIIILASLYSWRVVAGAVACSIVISQWFFIFSSFFFLSLALMKRCSELFMIRKTKRAPNSRRAYLVGDLPVLLSFGVCSGSLSILVLALFLSAPEIYLHYQSLAFYGLVYQSFLLACQIWLKTVRDY